MYDPTQCTLYMPVYRYLSTYYHNTILYSTVLNSHILSIYIYIRTGYRSHHIPFNDLNYRIIYPTQRRNIQPRPLAGD